MQITWLKSKFRNLKHIFVNNINTEIANGNISKFECKEHTENTELCVCFH